MLYPLIQYFTYFYTMRHLFLLSVLLIAFGTNHMEAKNTLKHVVSFEMVGTNIIIPIKVNNSEPLNFIFDTGVRHTIITELTHVDSITLNYMREVSLYGLGSGEPVQTYLSRENVITNNSLSVDSIVIYALKENIFQLSKHLGFKINGMIGYDLIKDYVFKLDYLKKKMYLYEHEGYVPPKRFKKVPITIKNQKPYMNGSVNINSEVRDVNLLVDTGAELALWLVSNNFDSYTVPEKTIYTYIGQGLSGEIFGNINRINSVTLANYTFKKPIVAFPDSAAIHMIIANNERDGTVGSELLRRFHIVLNYRDTSMYIKRNSYFFQKFSHNTTGMEIIQPYPKLPIYEVAELWDKSPAAQAGLKVGDKIESIDFRPTHMLKLVELKEILRKGAGKIRLVISRQEGTEIIRKKIKFDIYSL